jgi:methyl-accepting chemotaxis protein
MTGDIIMPGVKQLAEQLIIDSRIKGERLIAYLRLILIIPIFFFFLAIVLQHYGEGGLGVVFTDPAFFTELVCILLAIGLSFYTIRATNQHRYFSWMKYVLPFIDISMLNVIALFMAFPPHSGLTFTGAFPFFYFIFLLLYVLRNSVSSVLFSGIYVFISLIVLYIYSLAALGILDRVLAESKVAFVNAAQNSVVEIYLDDHIIKPLMVLMLTGLLMYIAHRFNRMIQEQTAQRVEKDEMRTTLTGNIKAITEKINNSSDTLVMSGEKFSENIGQMVESIGKIEEETQNENSAVEETSATISEMIRSIESVSQNIQSQAELVMNSVSAIEEVGSSINIIANTAKNANTLSGSLLEAAEHGEQTMNEVVEAIRETEKASKKIEEIVEIISSIASETNLLAMNAAIEAAHAGEAGKGFAVVADEIRDMAENAGGNAKLIYDILKDIRERIGMIVGLSQESSTGLQSILHDARETSNINLQILKAMEEESAAMKHILESIQELSKITEEVKQASVEQAAGGSEILKVVSEISSLTDSVSVLTGNQVKKCDEINIFTKELQSVITRNSDIIKELEELVSRL